MAVARKMVVLGFLLADGGEPLWCLQADASFLLADDFLLLADDRS